MSERRKDSKPINVAQMKNWICVALGNIFIRRMIKKKSLKYSHLVSEGIGHIKGILGVVQRFCRTI